MVQKMRLVVSPFDVPDNSNVMLLCCRLWPEVRVFEAELLVGGEVIRLLNFTLEINGMEFYNTFIMFLRSLQHWHSQSL